MDGGDSHYPENPSAQKTLQEGLNEEKIIIEQFGKFEDNIDILRYNTKVTIRNKSGRQLHSLKCGNFDHPTMLFLHGFAGSSLAYVKVLKKLSNHFRCFAFDWPGMGLSQRWEFDLKQEAQDIIAFFVEVIEEFRKANSIHKLSIVGHSFGGYIAANYMKAYPENIETLYLLSPMGGTQKPPVETETESTTTTSADDSGSGLWSSLESYVSGYVKKDRSTPQSILNKWYVPRGYAVSKIIKDTLKKASEEEQKAYIRFYNCVFSLPSINDSYIHDLVEYPNLDPFLSIQEVFQAESTSSTNAVKSYNNVHVLFGDSDFVDFKGCKELFKQEIWKGSLFFMHDSGHNVMIDQPENLVEMILKPTTINFN